MLSLPGLAFGDARWRVGWWRLGARCWRRGLSTAVGKSEFGLDGMVGGMTVIMMRLVRISSEAVGRAAKRSIEGRGITEAGSLFTGYNQRTLRWIDDKLL